MCDLESRTTTKTRQQEKLLWIDRLRAERSPKLRALKDGETVVRRSPACESQDCGGIRGGLIHDGLNSLRAGVSLEQTLTTLQNYDRDADYYRPQGARHTSLRPEMAFQVFLRLSNACHHRGVGYRIRNPISGHDDVRGQLIHIALA